MRRKTSASIRHKICVLIKIKWIKNKNKIFRPPDPKGNNMYDHWYPVFGAEEVWNELSKAYIWNKKTLTLTLKMFIVIV